MRPSCTYSSHSKTILSYTLWTLGEQTYTTELVRSNCLFSKSKRAYTIPRGFLQWLREASQLGFLRKLCSVYFYDFSVTLASPLQLLLGEIDMRLSADIIIWRNFWWGEFIAVRCRKSLFFTHTRREHSGDENLTRRQHSSSQQMLKVFCLFLVLSSPLNKYESRLLL